MLFDFNRFIYVASYQELNMKPVILIVLVLISNLSDVLSEQQYSGFKLLEISAVKNGDLTALLTLQSNNPKVSFWKMPARVNDVASCSVPPEEFSSFTQQLHSASLTYTIKQEDLGQQIVREKSQVQAQSRLSAGGFDLFNYNRHPEINRYLDSLVDKCNEKGLFCETFSIGNSFEGRPMKIIKIGSSHTHKPAVWIDAGIHAREWIAPATALVIANRLIYMYGVNSATTDVVDQFDWYILPSANPDGYEYSWDEDRFWRKTRKPNEGSTCVGTDPNRNWAFHWMETGASDEPCSEIYAGTHPFSELETENMSKFLLNETIDFALYISLHAYGQYWLTPWGYTDEVPNDYDELLDLGHTAADTIYSLYGKQFTVGSSTLVLYAAAGGSFDWTKGVAGIPFSLTAELRDDGEYGFLLPPSEIKEVGRETFLGIRSMVARAAEIRDSL